jgi:type IV pilus assembly protein PilZ
MSSERRRHRRVKLNLLVQFRLKNYEQFLAEYARDLSKGGMFVRTDDPKPEGSLLYFQFTTRDDGSLIEGLGRVVRVVEGTEPGMGIEFVNVEEPSQAVIEEIIGKRAGG